MGYFVAGCRYNIHGKAQGGLQRRTEEAVGIVYASYALDY
jgi:hypothetical protein